MPRSELSVYSIGSQVIVGESFAGNVTRISIVSNDKILYEVAWWDDKNRKCEWLEEFEVRAVDDDCRTDILFM